MNAPNLALPTASSQGIVARRIRFVTQVPAGVKERREFRQPRTCLAIEESIDLASLPCDRVWPEPTEHLLVLQLPRNAPAEWQRFAEQWLAPPQHPEAPQPIVVQGLGRKVQWRPGRAVIQELPQKGSTKGNFSADILTALVDFAFYEGELRNLELAVRNGERTKQEDVGRAYRIRYRDRKYWPHFGEMIEYFSKLRLIYADLEPRLYTGSRTLPGMARKWVEKLLEKADTEDRLEELTYRLEACEELYEAANDRIGDFRGYFYGHVLEVTIVLFLIAEVALMVAELILHMSEIEAPRQRRPR